MANPMTLRELADEMERRFLREIIHQDDYSIGAARRAIEQLVNAIRAAPATPPSDAVAMIAERLLEKFGVQCGMGELAMWRPIARAALDAASAQPTQEAPIVGYRVYKNDRFVGEFKTEKEIWAYFNDHARKAEP